MRPSKLSKIELNPKQLAAPERTPKAKWRNTRILRSLKMDHTIIPFSLATINRVYLHQ